MKYLGSLISIQSLAIFTRNVNITHFIFIKYMKLRKIYRAYAIIAHNRKLPVLRIKQIKKIFFENTYLLTYKKRYTFLQFRYDAKF